MHLKAGCKLEVYSQERLLKKLNFKERNPVIFHFFLFPHLKMLFIQYTVYESPTEKGEGRRALNNEKIINKIL